MLCGYRISAYRSIEVKKTVNYTISVTLHKAQTSIKATSNFQPDVCNRRPKNNPGMQGKDEKNLVTVGGN